MRLHRLTGIVLFGLGAGEILDSQTYDLKPDKRAASCCYLPYGYLIYDVLHVTEEAIFMGLKPKWKFRHGFAIQLALHVMF